MTFENMVARYRKITEHINDMKYCIESLQGELAVLDAQIFVACMEDKEKFNVFKRKTSSAGLAGREYFVMTFARKIERRLSPLARLDDQEWLATIEPRFVKSKLIFQSAALNAAVSSGEITDENLKDMGLRYVNSASLTVKRIPNDTELSKLRADAEALVGDE